MVKIYLDDLRDIPKGCIGARTYDEMVTYMRLFKDNVEEISLDHDLGTDSEGNLLKNGYDFVKLFCEEGMFASKIYIHTDNPVGRDNMYKTLLQARKRGFIDERIEIYHYGKYENIYNGGKS